MIRVLLLVLSAIVLNGCAQRNKVFENACAMGNKAFESLAQGNSVAVDSTPVHIVLAIVATGALVFIIMLTWQIFAGMQHRKYMNIVIQEEKNDMQIIDKLLEVLRLREGKDNGIG